MPALRHLTVSLVLAVGVAALAGPDEDFEASLRAQLEREAPAALGAWDTAVVAREAGPSPELEAALREVVRVAPDFDHAHRRLCSSLAARGQGEAGIAECRRALTLAASPENQVALAMALVAGPAPGDGLKEEARRLELSAVAARPDDYWVVQGAARVAMALQDSAEFERRVEKLQQLRPEEQATVQLALLVDVLHEDLSAARAKAARLPPDQRAHFEALISKVAWHPSPRRIAVLLGLLLGAWAAGLGLLFLLGLALSHATLRATERFGPGTTGAAAGGTVWLRRVYGGLIAATGVAFYVSLPLVALLVVGVGGALVVAMLSAGFVSVKLLLIVLVVGVASLGGLVKAVAAIFRRAPQGDPGVALPREAHPRLAQLLDEVSGRIGTRGPDQVFLSPGAGISVFERGSTLSTARGRGERCLVLGGGVLAGFRVDGFRAVLAHELGHFKNEDTAGGTLSLAVRRSLWELTGSLARGGAASRLNPAWLFIEGYHALFLRVTQGASRLQEVLADRWAVAAYGSRAFAEGLRHAILAGTSFDAAVNSEVKQALEAQRPLANLYASGSLLPVDASTAALQAPGSAYDSHPPPRARLAAALAMNVQVASRPGDEVDAWTLLEDRPRLEDALMAAVHRSLVRAGVSLPTAAAAEAASTVEAPAGS